MFFHPKNLKSENNKPWFKPWFDILLHTQSIVCAIVDSQCLEYLGYITLVVPKVILDAGWSKTVTENWVKKAPSVKTILANLETFAYIIFLLGIKHFYKIESLNF